jgi:hypothetical protein
MIHARPLALADPSSLWGLLRAEHASAPPPPPPPPPPPRLGGWGRPPNPPPPPPPPAGPLRACCAVRWAAVQVGDVIRANALREHAANALLTTMDDMDLDAKVGGAKQPGRPRSWLAAPVFGMGGACVPPLDLCLPGSEVPRQIGCTEAAGSVCRGRLCSGGGGTPPPPPGGFQDTE